VRALFMVFFTLYNEIPQLLKLADQTKSPCFANKTVFDCRGTI